MRRSNSTNMTVKRALLRLLVLNVCAGILVGCSSGARNAGPGLASDSSTTRSGTVSISFRWPTPSSTRLVPAASKSIKVVVLGDETANRGTVLAQKVLSRPAAGETSVNVIFTVPVGNVKLMATAYPNADGTGVAQAQVQETFDVRENNTASITLTMAGTIKSIAITPATTSVTLGGADISYVATAKDAAGAAVLTLPANLQWTVDNAAVATLTPVSGNSVTLHAVKAGTVNISVKETESGVSSALMLLTIVSTAPPVGTTNIIVADTVNHRVIGVDDITGKNFTVLAAGLYSPQDTAFDSAARVYIADYPVQLDRFDNILGKNPVAYKPASAASYLSVDKTGRIYYRDDDLKINRIDDISGAGHISFGGPSLFGGPQGIAIDSQNHIYVADSIKSRVYRYDDMTGANQKLFGSDGTLHLDLGGLNGGVGHNIAVDLGSRVYIADFNNKRIVRIDPAAFDDPLTANLAAFNVPASGTNVFKPLAVAVDSGTTPHIYFTGVYQDATGKTTDAAVFRMDDMQGTNLTRYGAFGSGTGQFSYPVSISVR
jgi:hypothetical protein